MTNITINNDGKQVILTSPYHPDLPALARSAGGDWRKPNWVFDARDEQRVRDLCVKVYGTDGSVAELVDVKVTFGEDYYEPKGPIFLLGRQIATAFGRDSGARLGTGVIVEEGGFVSSGSAKNWATQAKDGTIILLRDVPKSLIDQDSDDPGITIEVVNASANKDKLFAERDKLSKRLAEIDELLAEEDATSDLVDRVRSKTAQNYADESDDPNDRPSVAEQRTDAENDWAQGSRGLPS